MFLDNRIVLANIFVKTLEKNAVNRINRSDTNGAVRSSPRPTPLNEFEFRRIGNDVAKHTDEGVIVGIDAAR